MELKKLNQTGFEDARRMKIEIDCGGWCETDDDCCGSVLISSFGGVLQILGAKHKNNHPANMSF